MAGMQGNLGHEGSGSGGSRARLRLECWFREQRGGGRMRSGFVSKPLPCLNRHPTAAEKSIVCLFATPSNLAWPSCSSSKF